MMIQYDGAHSIDFFDDLQKSGTYKVTNSWRDLHLVPSKKPYVSPPKTNFNIVEVPYSNVILDLSDYQTGGPTHSLREGEWEFIVDADAWGGSDNAYVFLLKQFHGRRFYFELNDNPGSIYLARYEITSFESEDNYPTVKIKYITQPKQFNVVGTTIDGSEYEIDIQDMTIWEVPAPVYPEYMMVDVVDVDEEENPI